MSGILDSRSRIFDTIITQEGRKQLASGKLRTEFYSFSDSDAFYIQDTSMNGTEDANKRIYFEASSLPQDQITFEADDSGRLVAYKGSSVKVSNGKILTGSFRSNETEPVSGSQFASIASSLIGSSIDNFNKLRIIGSPDLFDENRNEFLLGKETVNFTITADKPIPKNQPQTNSVKDTESFFMDKRLSHVPNFMFLPPINKPRVGTGQASPLGAYARLGQRPIFEYEDLKHELEQLNSKGYQETVSFLETSKTNNLICQFFEVSNNEVVKLDVIDFGLFNTRDQEISKERLEKLEREGLGHLNDGTTRHIFFVGKVLIDENNTHTFINLFVLCFEN